MENSRMPHLHVSMYVLLEHQQGLELVNRHLHALAHPHQHRFPWPHAWEEDSMESNVIKSTSEEGYML